MIGSENLIELKAVPRLLPKRNGRRVSLQTVYRWQQVGIAGVRLEVLCVGGQMYTSHKYLRRFFAGVTAAKQGRRSSRANVSIDRVQQALDKELE